MNYKKQLELGLADMQEEILARRGVTNPHHYMNTNDGDILPYSLFGSVMEEAGNILKKAIDKGFGIYTLVDVDGDGYFSSAMLYSYIKKAFGVEIGFYIHNSKEHGLTDKLLFPTILEDAKSGKLKLLLMPDSGTGDFKECKILSDLGCKVIVLDHHQIEKEKNEHALIINPQSIEGYPNLSSSGTMVTWKFLKSIDDSEWTHHADDYLDLVACSTISDSMDIKNEENRHIINLGLSNIRNKFLSQMIDNDFRIKNTPPTIVDIQFFVSPMINGMVRSGTQEDKQLMFRAICEIDEEFDYVKRDKTQTKETIYARAVRLCVNAKSRQDRAIEKGIEIVIDDIDKNKRNDNKILFALCDDRLDRAFSGLVAQKLASRYNKPCVLLRENEKGDYFSGSIRNFNDSPLTNLKTFLSSLGYVAWLQGHESAAGIGLSKKQLIKTIELSNQKLADYDFNPIHLIDFDFDYSDLSALTTNFFVPIYELRYYWGQGISDVKVLITNIHVNSSKISFFGAREKSDNKNNWKFELKEEVDILNFRSGDDDFIFKTYGNNTELNWSGDEIVMDAICKVGRTEYNGEQRWCLMVEEYQIQH